MSTKCRPCSAVAAAAAEPAANGGGGTRKPKPKPKTDKDASNGGPAQPIALEVTAAAAAVQRAREHEAEYVEEEGRDFQGQSFTKCKPLLKLFGVNNPSFTEADEVCGPPLRPKAVNHVAIGANDVDAIAR
ncbi:hypothetical protein ABPG77_009469 [Micractinium sp. CCAP 211/92]